MAEDLIKWISNQHDGFGVIRPADDLLHDPQQNPPGASVTETYYFGFDVAEAAIHGFVYVWLHPNLNVLTAGTLISRGFQSTALAADYFNMHSYLDPSVHIDRTRGIFNLPGGLTITPVSPMQEWRVTLDDPGANTAFDLRFRAAMPPAVRADQKHFDQNMHVDGTLRLRGIEHQVDCHAIRDRSWQNLRSEAPLPVPPYDWISLCIGGRLAINLSLFDDLSVLGNPGGALTMPPTLLQDGWVWRDGVLHRIVEVTKRTERSADILQPLRHEIRAVDDAGQTYDIVGESVGGCNYNGWTNMLWHECLTRWTCNGEAGWGEVQEVQWHDCIRLLRPG
jgi:hypothetical protein